MSKSEDLALQIVNYINNNEFDEIEPYFGDMETAIKFLTKKGYIHLIDPFQLSSNLINPVIYSLLQTDETRDGMMKKLIGRLADVSEVDGNYYMVTDQEDLADWFKAYSRETSPYDVAKAILSDDNWEPYYDTTDDVFRDVVEELNPANLELLKQKILKELENVQIEINGRASSEMEEIASEQGHDEYLLVDKTNIDRIIKDDDTMRYLLRYEIEDIRQELYNIHSNAFNSAYQDEIYDDVWDEIYTYVDSDTKKDWEKWGKGYRLKLKITNHIEQVIDDWFYTYKKYADDFDYYGTYKGLIIQLMNDGDYEKLSFRIPEYPDSSKVDRNINEIFRDYI